MNQATRERAMRILMIGPLPPPVAGTTVLFRSLVEALGNSPNLVATVVNTVGVRRGGVTGLFRFLKLVRKVFAGMLSADVAALHVSTTGMHVMGPLVAVAARMLSTPLIIRKFGGTSVSDSSSVHRALSLWAVRRSDVYLVETKRLVERAKAEGLRQVQWYSNSRPMPELAYELGETNARCNRFIFLGQIRSEKGIRELVEAVRGLPDGLTVDLYGPLGFDLCLADLSGVHQLSYCGAVEPQDVHDLLLSFDVLVLPSYSEGYPGVVLEAYAARLPVVVARWQGVQELVDSSTGVTVEPRDAGALRDAMLELHNDPGAFADLRQGVMARRGDFSEELWQERFVSLCRELAK